MTLISIQGYIFSPVSSGPVQCVVMCMRTLSSPDTVHQHFPHPSGLERSLSPTDRSKLSAPSVSCAAPSGKKKKESQSGFWK